MHVYFGSLSGLQKYGTGKNMDARIYSHTHNIFINQEDVELFRDAVELSMFAAAVKQNYALALGIKKQCKAKATDVEVAWLEQVVESGVTYPDVRAYSKSRAELKDIIRDSFTSLAKQSCRLSPSFYNACIMETYRIIDMCNLAPVMTCFSTTGVPKRIALLSPVHDGTMGPLPTSIGGYDGNGQPLTSLAAWLFKHVANGNKAIDPSKGLQIGTGGVNGAGNGAGIGPLGAVNGGAGNPALPAANPPLALPAANPPLALPAANPAPALPAANPVPNIQPPSDDDGSGRNSDDDGYGRNSDDDGYGRNSDDDGYGRNSDDDGYGRNSDDDGYGRNSDDDGYGRNSDDDGYGRNSDDDGYGRNSDDDGYGRNSDDDGYGRNSDDDGYGRNSDDDGYGRNSDDDGYGRNSDDDGYGRNSDDDGYGRNSDDDGYGRNSDDDGYGRNSDDDGYGRNSDDDGYGRNSDDDGYGRNSDDDGYGRNSDDDGSE